MPISLFQSHNERIIMSNSDDMKPGYCVLIDDNFHYMDEERRSHVAIYANYEHALERAKEITRKSVLRNKGATYDETFENYMDFGDDPFIQAIGDAPRPKERYSAWTAAKLFAKEIHGEADVSQSRGESQ